MKRMMAVLLLAACGDDGTGPSGASLTGSWTFSQNFSNQQVAISCQNNGSAILSHTGNNLSGSTTSTGSCSGPGGVIDNSGTATISGGQVNGAQVTFQAAGCNYTGTVSGSPPNRINGTLSCVIAVAGQQLTFTGTWQAGK